VNWLEWMRSGEWQADTALPMLPALAHEVVEIAFDPDVPARRIIGLVSRDPVLATRVIQLAKSAFSAPAIEITSISDAVMRLGTAPVRNILSATCLTSMLADPRIYGSRGRELADHAIGTAYVAWLIAERAGVRPDEAFLAALLHDIGKLGILKAALDPAAGVAEPAPDEVTEFIDEQHAACGGMLLTIWRLPQRLQDPVVYHHRPELARDYSSAAAVTYVANRLAHRYGFGCPPQDIDALQDPVFAAVGVDERMLQRIDEHAPELFEKVRNLEPRTGNR
jgi:putative nucleotidyltransferase with HDIG domain